jgi:hypothetical protein
MRVQISSEKSLHYVPLVSLTQRCCHLFAHYPGRKYMKLEKGTARGTPYGEYRRRDTESQMTLIIDFFWREVCETCAVSSCDFRN